MNFKPGDKVWVDNQPGGFYPGGTYAAVLIEYCGDYARPASKANAPAGGWWHADIEGIPPVNGTYPFAHETNMRRRDDPPGKDPQREEVGEWALCPWQPAHSRKEVS